MEFCDLDYFLSKDKIVYLVKGYYHTSNGVFAYPVFWPDPNGSRVHPTLGYYTKNVNDFNEKIFIIHPEYRHDFIPRNTPLVKREDITQVFHPTEKVPQFLEKKENNVWHKLFEYFIKESGMPRSDIGIFGSYLVDLNRDRTEKHIKDVDFAIYGIDNLYKIKNTIEKLLKNFGFSHISKEHILYHKDKFGKYFDSSINSFEKTLANKWSSIQIAPGLLATLRFVYKPNEIPPNPVTTPIDSPIKVEGVVIEDIGTNFIPRVFKIRTKTGAYTVVTYFWGFQSCVKNGDIVLVTGNLHKNNTVVSVDAASHGIRILS